jgi:hypothetical protein
VKEMNSNVDQKLNSDAQIAVAKVVSSIPEDTLSMVWRSELNEAIRLTAVNTKRHKFVFSFGGPIAGLGVACALALIVPITLSRSNHRIVKVDPPVATVPASPSIEEGLLQVHQDDVRMSDVAGTGLNPTEAVAPSQPRQSDDDSEDDIQL